MQAAGDLVAAAVAELAAGVQDGEHDLERPDLSSFSIFATGMPRPLSTTVTELSGWIVDRDRVAVAGQRLVDRVVDDLVDEVVQAAHAGRADVHAGTLAHGLEALEDRDVLGVVARLLLSVRWVVRCSRCLSSTQATPRRDDGPSAGRGVAFSARQY